VEENLRGAYRERSPTELILDISASSDDDKYLNTACWKLYRALKMEND
jgi:hypothetical protein